MDGRSARADRMSKKIKLVRACGSYIKVKVSQCEPSVDCREYLLNLIHADKTESES